MIVVVPYADGMLHSRVFPAIRRQGYEPEAIECVPSYQQVLAQLWLRLMAGDDIAVVEHDVESRIGALRSFEDCPELHCFHPYKFNQPFEDVGLEYAPLGHTRFRSALGEILRELSWSEPWRALSYRDLDHLIGKHLAAHGVVPHRHELTVIHHHDYH